MLPDDLANEIISSAGKLLLSNGIGTKNSELLRYAANCGHLAIRSDRIFPSAEIFQSCMMKIKSARVPSRGKAVNNHDWQDMLINRGEDSEWIIKVTDLPYQFCDYQNRKITPLSHSRVIQGTKLLDVLSKEKNIRGSSCGVPQDTHPFLKAVEQYLIGFRHNRNGGATIQSIPMKVEPEFTRIRSSAEDWDDLAMRDLMFFSPSPMALDADDLYLCFKKGIYLRSFMVGSMPKLGMTGPVNPAGIYIQAVAEVIGAATVLHAIFP